MQSLKRSNAAFLLFLIIASAFYLGGVPDVPFHPDESTYIYMSADAETLLTRPSAQYWQPDRLDDPRQRYRILDGPLNRVLIGLGRWLAGQPALAEDWDWSATWIENQQRGALPNADLLLASRYAVAALYPFSLIFFFLTAKRFLSLPAAWAAVILLASNSLVLLHTRRAMAEGGLIFTTVLVMWSLSHVVKQPWRNAVPAALAVCAKYSLAALVPAGFLAALWQPGASWRKRLGHAALFAALLLTITALLHPVYWAHPAAALRSAVETRTALAAAQVDDFAPLALDTPAEKMIGMAGALYLTPPMFAEAGNYAAETRAAEAAYLANPLHSLFRSLGAGSLVLVLSLAGWLFGVLRLRQSGGKPQRELSLLLAAGLLQSAGLYLMVPLAWQRYYLPLVPFACLWCALALEVLVGQIRVLRESAGRAHLAAHAQEK